MTALLETHRLAERDVSAALRLLEHEPAATFLRDRLERPRGTESPVYGVWDGSLVGLAMLVERMAPFGMDVVLPAGRRVDLALAEMAAELDRAPRMTMGPEGPTREADAGWPASWPARVARRDEILFVQPRPPGFLARHDLVFRAGRGLDVERVASFRLAMEEESGVAIGSTRDAAIETVRELVGAERLWVVEKDWQVVGCVAISARSDRHEQLGFVYVQPQLRLTGVSDFLLGSLCRRIHGSGRRPLLFTASSSEALIARANALGFTRIGSHHKYYYGEESP